MGDILGGKNADASLKRRAREAGIELLSDSKDSLFHTNFPTAKWLKRRKKLVQ